VRLLVSSYYYPPSIGGVERQSHLLARGLVERGHSVRVITARQPGFKPREVLDGVEILRVSPGRGSRWQKMATYLVGMLAATLRWAAWAEVIQVQQILYPAGFVSLISPVLRRPLVVRNAGSGEFGGVQLMRRMPAGNVVLRVIAHAATGVSLNAEMTAEMRTAGFRHVVEIPNGVDVPPPSTDAMRGAARDALGVTGRVVLYAGRLDREKGVDVLIEAWPRVGIDDATLVIVGDGPERTALTHLADRIGCESSVRFVGSTTQMLTFFAAADVFVLPSRSEGISNALLEAMASGLPVVATDVGGNRQVIECSNMGTLVPSEDPAVLAGALAAMLVNAEMRRRIGVAARNHVRARYSAERMVDAYEHLYLRMLPRF